MRKKILNWMWLAAFLLAGCFGAMQSENSGLPRTPLIQEGITTQRLTDQEVGKLRAAKLWIIPNQVHSQTAEAFAELQYAILALLNDQENLTKIIQDQGFPEDLKQLAAQIIRNKVGDFSFIQPTKGLLKALQGHAQNLHRLNQAYLEIPALAAQAAFADAECNADNPPPGSKQTATTKVLRELAKNTFEQKRGLLASYKEQGITGPALERAVGEVREAEENYAQSRAHHMVCNLSASSANDDLEKQRRLIYQLNGEVDERSKETAQARQVLDSAIADIRGKVTYFLTTKFN